jgi:predicted nucleic acid-binding protein
MEPALPVRLTIADAGPLIVLSRVGKLDLLQQVFGQLCITDAVRDELLAGGAFPGQGQLEAALADWVDVVTVDVGSWEPANLDLGAGEVSSLYLASNNPGSLLILDDAAARREADWRSLSYVGLIGVVLEAKRQGYIWQAGPLLQSLQQAGYFLSERLLDKALAAVGETKQKTGTDLFS